MAIKLITPPVNLPVTLASARRHLRIHATGSPAVSDHDTEITEKIEGVVAEIENPLGDIAHALITQTWELYLDGFPAEEIQLPIWPVQDVTFVKYTDVDEVLQTVATSAYSVDTVSNPSWIVPGVSGWPTAHDGILSMVVRFVTGYGDDPDDVPKDIRDAILLRLEADFDRNTDADRLITRSNTLLAPVARRFPFIS